VGISLCGNAAVKSSGEGLSGIFKLPVVVQHRMLETDR
jgi:hypothetical protein